MAADHFCLRWNNYQSNMVSELDILRTEEYLVDVTLCCEGHKFRAHKVILSACSPYFRNVFKENPCEHPVVILKDVSPEDVEALLSFVYQGVVYVSEKKLTSFLQTAELLQIKGLAGAASSLNEEHAKQMQSPGKRRKTGAPVRIVKQEDGDESNSNQMEAEEDKQDYVEDMDDNNTSYQDEDGSVGEESESENSGEVTATNYPPADAKQDAINDNRLGQARNDVNMMQHNIARQQPPLLRMPPAPPQPPLDNSLQGSYQLSSPNQSVSDLLSTTAERNGRRPCPLCTKVISNKSNLLKHMRIRHSGAYNPACCVLCNKIFKNKYSLRAHLNIYHKEYLSPSHQPPSVSQPAPIESTVHPQYLPSN